MRQAKQAVYGEEVRGADCHHRRLHSEVTALPHGDADVCKGKCCGIVNTVTDHGHPSPLCLEATDMLRLPLGQYTCDVLDTSDLLGDGLGSSLPIPCEHDDVDPSLA